MTTQMLFPAFCTVDDWRGVVRNNERVHHVELIIESDESFLPRILVDAGFFPSSSQVKKNRPDLWRDRGEFDLVNLQWAQVEIWPLLKINTKSRILERRRYEYYRRS